VGSREWCVLDDVSTAVPGIGFCSGGFWGADITLDGEGSNWNSRAVNKPPSNHLDVSQYGSSSVHQKRLRKTQLYLGSMDTRMGPPTGLQEMLPKHYKMEGGCIADRETRYNGE